MRRGTKTEPVCNKDCFHCPFPDCVADDTMDLEDYREARERDLDIRRTPEQKKIAAKKKAYYEANREEIAAKQKAYYEANREELAAKQKAYREANREEIAAKKKAYYEANREELAAYQKAYREANREELAAKQKAYYEANREELAAKQKAYYEANREELAAKQSIISRVRRSAGISQQVLSEALGISRPLISHFECGRVYADVPAVLARIAELAHMSVETLMEEAGA